MAEVKQLREEWKAFDRLLNGNMAQLKTRNSMIKAIQAGAATIFCKQSPFRS